MEFIIVEKGWKKKHCKKPGCRKLARHHILLGYKTKEPHSLCKRHYRRLIKLTKKQISERGEMLDI